MYIGPGCPGLSVCYGLQWLPPDCQRSYYPFNKIIIIIKKEEAKTNSLLALSVCVCVSHFSALFFPKKNINNTICIYFVQRPMKYANENMSNQFALGLVTCSPNTYERSKSFFVMGRIHASGRRTGETIATTPNRLWPQPHYALFGQVRG